MVVRDKLEVDSIAKTGVNTEKHLNKKVKSK